MATALSVNNISGMKSGNQFVAYNNPQDSLNATTQDIANKQKGITHTGLNGDSTLEQFVNTWIHGVAGRTPGQGYTADDVSKQLGVTPQTKLGSVDPKKLALAVAKFETGYSGDGSVSAASTTNGNATSTNGKKDYNTFAEAIKQKYPSYQNADNLTLTKAILQKYPQYASQVSLPGDTSSTSTDTPKPDASGYVTTPAPETPTETLGNANPSTGDKVVNILGTLSGENAPGNAIAGGILPHTQDYKNAQVGQQNEEQSKLQLLKAIRTQTDPAKKQHLTQAYKNIYGQAPDVNLADINPAKDVTGKKLAMSLVQAAAEIASSGTYGEAAGVMDTGQMAPIMAKEFLPSLLTKGAGTIGKHPLMSGLIGDALLNRLPPKVKNAINKTVPILKNIME